MKGKLITFEGCEGCGKSTQTRLLKEYLEKNGVDFIIAREPGGTEISEKIRAVILDKNNKAMSDECEALLYAASRAQIIKEVVLPALESGKLVILDRYIDSSLAYQVYARGLSFDFVKKINSYCFENCMPDLTIFMNVSPDEAFERKGGVDKQDRIELLGIDFHRKVYAGYLELAKTFSDRIVPFSCKGTKFETHAKIIEYLKEREFIK